MYFCFIVEEQYRHDSMPMVIAERLLQWGHTVDLLEPSETVTCLSDLTRKGYDAYVLKTVAGGPGLSILQAAEAVGIPTINNSRSISLVRDKTIASAFAQDRKSTRLNSSHANISYPVFCLKKKKNQHN